MQAVQDVFIQKKLLYKFDKKIQQIFQSIFVNLQNESQDLSVKMIDQKQQSEKKQKFLSKQSLIQQIQQLKFQNFKYRTTLVSAQKDQQYNQEILKKAEQQILQSKNEVESLSKQLQFSLQCRRNKQSYNSLGESLKSTYEPLGVQKSKLGVISKQIEQMQQKYQRQRDQYQKKQKCLKLALSALKCIIDTEDMEVTNQQQLTSLNTNATSYQKQNGYFGFSQHNKTPLTAQASYINSISSQRISTIPSSRQEGQQPEGGEILY